MKFEFALADESRRERARGPRTRLSTTEGERERGDDCFKSRGIFISPTEIENALQQNPAIVEAAVIAEPDPEIGNRIRAVVVLAEAYAPSPRLAEAILDDLRGRIAPFKLPHAIRFASSLPKSPVGKILRSKLTGQSEMS